MADKKISQLTTLEASAASSNDYTVVVDTSDTTMSSSGTTKKMRLDALADYVSPDNLASFSWDSASSSPASSNSSPRIITNIHKQMRRCVLNDAGVVQYYLSDLDSTKKADGTAANIDGTDGQVMVEIPKFYARRVKVGTVTTWSISAVPRDGYVLHPAFVKDGVEVDFRYYGAYDACYWDDSSSAYASGLNLDALTVDTSADKLASVSGAYPIVGVTRATSRALAANRGTGWRLADFWLVQAVQMLYLVEYQTYYSQNILGAGNTNGSYVASSSNQADSPHTVAGASNSWGNSSTNGTQPSAGAKPGTAYMSFRGIENWYGNCWNWIDGFNINNNQAYVSNTRSHFADDTSTNYTALGTAMPNSNNYVTNHQDVDNAWLPASVGGSSSTYWTDYYYQASGWRVALFGGLAVSGALAGGFSWLLYYDSSSRNRLFGARLAY